MQNLTDANSGFNAMLDGYNRSKGGAQYLHLSAPQALAFVRERDNLQNGDLDRTHRQQAVLDYVIWKLEHDGVLSDLGQLTSLLNTAKQYLITDSTWKLLDFAPQMKALTGKNLQFYTAPIEGYATIDGQDANQVDIPTIQAAIGQKFTAPAPAAPSASTAKSYREGRVRPARVDRHRGRVQRRDSAWPGHRRLAGACRQGLQGRRRHQRVGAVAGRRRGHSGVLRLGRVRPTRPRSRTTSARPPSRSRRWPQGTSRCSSVRVPPWCRPLWPRLRLLRKAPPLPRPVTTARPAALSP